MQSVKFTVAFLNSVLSAVRQHFDSEDLKRGKFRHERWDMRKLCPAQNYDLSLAPHVSPPYDFRRSEGAFISHPIDRKHVTTDKS